MAPKSEWEKEMHPTNTEVARNDWFFSCPTENDFWKYNPLLYTSTATRLGKNPYKDKRKSKAATEGKLEPHISAKFQKFSCGIHRTGLDEYIRCEFWNHTLEWGLQDKVETSSLFWALSQLLSRVQVVKSLEIILGVDGSHDPLSQEAIEDRILREDFPSDQIIRSGPNGFRYWLRGLRNVEDFELKVQTHDFDFKNPTYRKLGEKSGQVVEELKKEVCRKLDAFPPYYLILIRKTNIL